MLNCWSSFQALSASFAATFKIIYLKIRITTFKELHWLAE